MIVRWSSPSAEDTRAVGRELGRVAKPGLLVALEGQLGAGKTQFTRGLYEGLGLAEAHWNGSPTFVLATRYAGSPGLTHADFYRLVAAGEVADLGLDDASATGDVVVVEWADRFIEALPKECLRVRFTWIDEHRRELVFEAVGAEPEACLEAIARQQPMSAQSNAGASRGGVGPVAGTAEGARWP